MGYKSFIFLLSFISLLLPAVANAQSGKVPPFRIVQTDGKIFKAEDLPFNKPIIIIYFSPECEDCQQLTDNLLKHVDELKSSSVAMITYLSTGQVSEFVSRNNLSKYSNIYVGTEGNSLFVLNYYKINKFPFAALYSENGDLIKKYPAGKVDLNDLLLKLKSL